jgi:ABC-type sulfate/molybdate transport systems ATPase subunit
MCCFARTKCRCHKHELEDHHAAEVRDIRPLGATTRVTLKVEGQTDLIEAEVVKDHDSLIGLARGETLFFKPKVWQKVASSLRSKASRASPLPQLDRV